MEPCTPRANFPAKTRARLGSEASGENDGALALLALLQDGGGHRLNHRLPKYEVLLPGGWKKGTPAKKWLFFAWFVENKGTPKKREKQNGFWGKFFEARGSLDDLCVEAPRINYIGLRFKTGPKPCCVPERMKPQTFQSSFRLGFVTPCILQACFRARRQPLTWKKQLVLQIIPRLKTPSSLEFTGDSSIQGF